MKKPLKIREGLRRLFFTTCLLSVGVVLGEMVPPSDPRIVCAGQWAESGEARETVWPGSVIEFQLKGKARFFLKSGRPGSVRVSVMVGDTRAWDGLVLEPIVIDGGDELSPVQIMYESTSGAGYDPGDYRAVKSVLTFEGIELMPDGELFPPRERDGPVMWFLGDSITQGMWTDKPDPDPLFNSRASHSYAHLLAEWFRAPYAWFAYAGMTAGGLSHRLFYYRNNLPVQTEHSPDWIFLNIGANDARLPDEDYAEDLEALVKKITVSYPDARLVLLNFFRNGDQRREFLKKLAKNSGEKIHFFEARDHIIHYGDRARIHPDWRSHASLATVLEEWIKSTGKSHPER